MSTKDEPKTFRDVEKAIFERNWVCGKKRVLASMLASPDVHAETLLLDPCDGEMVGLSFGHAGHGNDWLHKCNKCGHEAWSAERYPHLIYRDEP